MLELLLNLLRKCQGDCISNVPLNCSDIIKRRILLTISTGHHYIKLQNIRFTSVLSIATLVHIIIL